MQSFKQDNTSQSESKINERDKLTGKENRGFFISIEGTDGSGKSTQLELLIKYFSNSGADFVFLREPGGTPISEQIREIILDEANTAMTAETEMLLYAASRAQLVREVIAPAVEAGRIVICDRFVDSSFAYQAFARGLPLEMVEGVNKTAVAGYMPDLTLLFDLSPEDAQKRRNLRADVHDRMENEAIDFHNQVYDGYKKLTERYASRIRVIDASKSIEEVHKNAVAEIERLILR